MIRHFSASSAKTYLMCPAKWHYRYIEQLPDPAGPAMERGTMVHAAIERYWRNHYDKPEAGLHRYISAYRKMEGAVTPDRVWHVELNLTAHLPGVPVPITGYLDLLTNDGLIIDLKTAGRHWPSERALSELQPALYTWLATQHGFLVERFEFHLLVGDGTDRQVIAQRLPVVLSNEEIESHLDEVRSAWRGIAAEEFPPKPQILCGYCNFQNVCKPDRGRKSRENVQKPMRGEESK